MKKEHQIIMLPSESESFIHTAPWDREPNNGLFISSIPSKTNKGDTIAQHLYILSDEEIKDGDWFLKPKYKEAVKTGHEVVKADESYFGGYGYDWTDCKKIIATTDPKLHTNEIVEEDMHMYKKSLPQIPQSFIEEYCKAGGIDEVLVEYEQHCSAISDYIQRRPIDRNVYLKPALKDNIIIIHPVEEKMYSRDEVIKLCEDAFAEGGFGDCTFNKWIEENL